VFIARAQRSACSRPSAASSRSRAGEAATLARIEEALAARFDEVTAQALGPRFAAPLLVIQIARQGVAWRAGEAVAASVRALV